MKNVFLIGATAAIALVVGCKKDDSPSTPPPPPPPPVESEIFKNHSAVEAFFEILPDFSSTVKGYTLISSSDAIAASPNFVFGGAPDGQGFLKNPDGSGYVMVTNHENAYSISRVYLDKKLNPTKGEYLLNTDGGMFRLCSGSLATDEHGFTKPVFLSTGESNVDAMTHAIDPLESADPSNKMRVKPALGKFSGENSVPLGKDAYPGKTAIILGEDASNGQVYLYVSDTPGDLDNGSFYVLRRKNQNQIETDIVKGGVYPIEFVKIDNAKALGGAQIDEASKTLKAIQFARVEDLDYRKGGKGNSREIYFTATGISGVPEKTYWGRVYRLILSEISPFQGSLEIIEDGDLSPGVGIINPDNICVTENYVYIQEDGDSFFPGASHNSLVWQYDIAKGTKKKMIEPKNKALSGTKYNPTNDQRFGAWEYGAMIDISDIIGEPNTFLLNIHAHTWIEDNKFYNPSLAIAAQSYKSGGQTLILKGVPR